MMCDNCSHFPICPFEVAPDECPYFLSNDVVDVVRCKDCKHRNRLAYCPLCGVMVTPDDYFCADGERKYDE